ncbi:hypothetical protein B0H11DRAFT_1905940 [Mycena galericulata]|nr:hypothetical protein B0H11DRAFT_1905940 [Mycena galericulata]
MSRDPTCAPPPAYTAGSELNSDFLISQPSTTTRYQCGTHICLNVNAKIFYDQCNLIFNVFNRLLPKAGLCYVQCSINDPAYNSIAIAPPPEVEIDYIDIKIGETKEIVQRRADYEAKCKGKHFVWAFYYYATNEG